MRTGTEPYRDLPPHAPDALGSTELTTRLLVLQSQALMELSPELQGKAHVIRQSAEPVARMRSQPGGPDRDGAKTNTRF